MIESDYKPIIVVPFIVEGDGVLFLRYDRKIRLKGKSVKGIIAILAECNGRNTVEQINEKIDSTPSFIDDVLKQLIDLEILCDSRSYWKSFHRISSNPQPFQTSMSHEKMQQYCIEHGAIKNGFSYNIPVNSNSVLFSLQENRESCRSFDCEKQLDMPLVGNICNYAYSLDRHAVPSGGGLYPLKLFVIVVRDQIDLRKGYYEYDADKNVLILFKEEVDVEQLKYSYDDETLAFGSPIQLVMCLSFDAICKKYSNRGYRLGLIEAGQVAQNVVLFCAEKGLATCEMGGIQESALSSELDLPKEVCPVISIAIGYKSSHQREESFFSKLVNIEKKIVGEKNIIKSYGVHTFNDDASFWGGWARFGDKLDNVSGATGSSYYESIFKALVEGYERYLSSCYREDFFGVPYEGIDFVSLNDLAPLSTKQRIKMGLIEYNEQTPIGWVKDMTGEHFIPSELVFYGFSKDRRTCFSTSSGVAAYSDYMSAKKKALAELVERDAIMRTWYEKRSPYLVNPELVSTHVKNKTEHWKKRGRKVMVFELQSDYLPVFLAVIVGEEYPSFVSGAASTFGSIEDAINKAFREAEYNLLLALSYPIDNTPLKENVKTPMDHGRYYYQSENSKKISWLWKNNTYSNNDFKKVISYDQLAKQLDVMFVDLSENNGLIKVVRAISRKLIPISFGYNQDYYLHPEACKLGMKDNVREIPHFFA